MWFNAGLIGLGAVFVCLFGEETMYNPNWDYKAEGLISRIQALTGITGYKMKNKGTGTVVRDMLIMTSRPHFFGLCGTSFAGVICHVH